MSRSTATRRLALAAMMIVLGGLIGFFLLPRSVGTEVRRVVDLPAPVAVTETTPSAVTPRAATYVRDEAFDAPSPLDSSSATRQHRTRARVEKQYEGALAVYKRKDFKLSEGLLRQCVKMDPTYPECRKLLGATLGQLGKGEAGAAEYDRFLELAPDHPQATKVRALLAAYRAVPSRGR